MRRIGAIFGALLLAVILAVLGIYAYYHLPYDDRAVGVRVVVPEGEPFDRTTRSLAEKGLVRYPLLFSFLARSLGMDRRVRAGEYALDSSMSPKEILARLCKGAVILHKVTIPEGYTLREIADVLHRSGLADPGAFLKRTRDADFIRSLGIQGSSLEGYLFPDTYFFPKGFTPREILKAMVARFRSVYGDELRARQAELGWSLQKVVTLASIVEKETGRKEERPLIASVLINRLRVGMPLQSDPTVIYGLDSFDGNLKRVHLEEPGPYNTYTHRGLPPGPICNPGLDSLRAVLFPANTPYLYFVSKNDGTHYFSSRLKEHNRAVRVYQQNRGKGSRSTGRRDTRGVRSRGPS